jgi:flagellar hook-associated protein 3 FlgL
MTVSIGPFVAGGYERSLTTQRMIETRARLDDLSRQLSSGRRAETYGDLGPGRRSSLDAHAKLSQIGSYMQGIEQADLRVKTMTTSLEVLSRLSLEARGDLVERMGAPADPARPDLRAASYQRLSLAIDALNVEIGGTRLFAGRASDTDPLPSAEVLLDGLPATGTEPARAGLRALADERLLAHGAKPPALDGRLALAHDGVSPSLTIAPSPSATFGFELRGATAAFTTLTPGADPASDPATLAINRVPQDGETLVVELADRLDAPATYRIELTARSSGPVSQGEFLIGADAAQTAANVRAALEAAIAVEARDRLAPRVVAEVAGEFFASDPASNPVRRVDAVAAPAEAYVAGDASTQVLWYRGEVGAPGDDPRQAARLRIDESQVVGVGARANEEAIARLVSDLATFALAEFGEGPVAQAAFDEIARPAVERTRTEGAGSIQQIAIEVGFAATSAKDASKRHAATEQMLRDVVDEVEGISQEEVAARILALQTSLEASFRATALLSRLSLANYL